MEKTVKVLEKSFMFRNVYPVKGDSGRLWFDIETYKEPVMRVERDMVPDWPNSVPGKPLKKRMKTFMICVAYFYSGNLEFRVAYSLDEEAILEWFAGVCAGSYEAAYFSQNNFDRLVLEGKWTTARRKRLDNPGPWPNIDDGYGPDGFPYRWVNVWKNKRNSGALEADRGEEIANADILKYAKGTEKDVNEIMVHCLRDVAMVLLEDADYELDRKLSGWLWDLFTEDIEWDEETRY